MKILYGMLKASNPGRNGERVNQIIGLRFDDDTPPSPHDIETGAQCFCDDRRWMLISFRFYSDAQAAEQLAQINYSPEIG